MMRELLGKLRNLICYCGLTKAEYASIKKQAYISNFTVWKYLHILITVGFACITVAMLPVSGFTEASVFQLLLVGYSAMMAVCFFVLLDPESLTAQLLIYITMILLLLYALFMSLDRPNMMSVSFIVMLVMLPMFMIDKPYYMIILQTGAITVFLMVIRGYKPLETFRYDLVDSLFYGCLGIVINIFYNSIRIREFILKNNESAYIEQQRAANEETKRLNASLKTVAESVLELMGDVVESRDASSGRHVRRVKGFTYILAQQVMNDLPEYGLNRYQVNLMTSTAALHDVGKIATPDAILNKPGKLNEQEFEIMKKHCVIGCEILAMKGKWSQDYMDMGISICMNHHEKWDGKGYPRGLKGDEIPIAAQIVSVADIYDALTTKRVYKDAFSFEKAFRMIVNGECGAFSDKLMACFIKCREKFEEHARDPEKMTFDEAEYELVSTRNPQESFVIGLHDQDNTLRERVRLNEELSVLESLSEQFLYICYVDTKQNEVIRVRADRQIQEMVADFDPTISSNKRFDMLLRRLIVPEDFEAFLKTVERDSSMEVLRMAKHISTDFRIELPDGIHYSRLRISLAMNDPDAVIIGISKRDEEHEREMEYLRMQQEVEVAKRERENQAKLADRLAVIDCISNEYDYVCSLNADTMEVVVYQASAWIRERFRNLEDIVVSPEARSQTLKGIILPEDFESFQFQSQHSEVLKGLIANHGIYCVNYRGYMDGRLIHYQTRYMVDKNNPKRIVIGLREVKK